MCSPKHSSEYPMDLRKYKQQRIAALEYDALGVEAETRVGHDERI